MRWRWKPNQEKSSTTIAHVGQYEYHVFDDTSVDEENGLSHPLFSEESNEKMGVDNYTFNDD